MIVTCKYCNQDFEFKVDPEGYIAWLKGTPIQVALHTLPPDQRELLMTETCGSCWDEMWEEKEDSDYDDRD